MKCPQMPVKDVPSFPTRLSLKVKCGDSESMSLPITIAHVAA